MSNYIDRIVDNSACGRHSVQTKTPCFTIRRDDGGTARAVCDFRAKKFFIGKISPLSKNQPNKAPRFNKNKKK